MTSSTMTSSTTNSGKDLLTASRFDEMQEGQRRRLSHNDAFIDDGDDDDGCGGNGGDGGGGNGGDGGGGNGGDGGGGNGDDGCSSNGGDGCDVCVNPLDGNNNQNTKTNHANHSGKNKGKSKKHNRKRRGST